MSHKEASNEKYSVNKLQLELNNIKKEISKKFRKQTVVRIKKY